MNENHIRRERMRKAEKKKMVEDMRAALPVFNLEQIRQYRMPFHEALLTNLHDRGYVFTSQYVKQLMDIQDNLRQEAGPLSQVWARPQLKFSKPEMTELCDSLVRYEDHYNAGNYDRQCEEVLRIAIRFAFSNINWWWLGEQLLIQSLNTSANSKHLGDKYQALSRYTYGKFLIENFKEFDSAVEHLKAARQLSIGKEWTNKIICPDDCDVLFLKVNFLLYTCLIRQVEALMETDLRQAAKLAAIARKRAADACYPKGEITALMLKGMCELSWNDTKGAIATFTKSYYIEQKLGSAKGLCESKIHIAQAYLLDGNTELSLNTLLMLKESADEFNLPYYLAQSYRQLGEYFLNNGQAGKATPLLVEALKIFQERNYIKESEQVRNLEAISRGLEKFSDYVGLITKSKEPEYLLKLIDWKDSREPFHESHEHLEPYNEPVEVMIRKSIAEVRSSVSRHYMPTATTGDGATSHEHLGHVVSFNERPEVITEDEEDAE